MTALDFDALYRRHAHDVLSYTANLIRDDFHAAEDVAQQAWLTAWEQRNRYEDDRPPLGWLKTLAKYAALNMEIKPRRLRGTVRPVPLGDDVDALAGERIGDNGTGLPGLADPQTVMALDEVMRRLPPRQWEAVDLYHIQGRPLEEVADRMGVKYHSAFQNAWLGLKRIRLYFHGETVAELAQANRGRP